MREFLMLAHEYDPKINLKGYYVSEKLDGQRAFWDGGISRGIPKSQIPWANTAKDGRYRQEIICTGLWSRYGHVIHAPDWWLDKLPAIPLDGELWLGRQTRQELATIIKPIVPSEGWRIVKYYIFDSPALCDVFQNGTINNPNFKKTFEGIVGRFCTFETPLPFKDTLLKLSGLQNDVVEVHEQWQLGTFWRDEIEQDLEKVSNDGGEGLVVRAPNSFWVPKRSWNLLKIKALKDAEGTVVGYYAGKGKLQGMMGSLIVNWEGVQFELSGFTDVERMVTDASQLIPGERIPDTVECPKFPRGSTVTFRYRDKTRDGMPVEARYWRTPCDF